MEVNLLSSSNLVEDIWEFRFSKPQALVFDAGDYVELSLETGGSRWLSIAASPQSDGLSFITKISNPRSQFKQAMKDMKVGQIAKISPAIGNFNLPPTDKSPLLWIAGGIGISPYLSMLRWLKETPERQPRIKLIYSAKPNQHIYIDELKKSVSKITLLDKRASIEDVVGASESDSIIYISGPEPLSKQLFEQLLSQGLSRNKIKLDYFEGYDTL